MPEDYRNRWERENRARIIVVAKPEERDTFKAAADEAGQSLNAYIVQAVRERVQRERRE